MTVPPAARHPAHAQHYRGQPHAGQAGTHAPPAHQPSPYTPSAAELTPGPRNRLWLSLRSGIDAEIDWALPLLVLASYDRPDVFFLDLWPDSVAALQEWPVRWVEDLEREAAYGTLIREPESSSPSPSSSSSRTALGAIPDWTRNPATEQRAALCLQVLRNASQTERNTAMIAKTDFPTAFLARFFSLPTQFLIEVATRSPEPFQHVLVILQSLYDRIVVLRPFARVFGTVLPTLAMETADIGVLILVLPVLIRAFANPGLPSAPEGFTQHMLYFLTLNPPAPLLDLVLDLLAVLASVPAYARIILSDPSFVGYLKSLVHLLEYGARPENAYWSPTLPFRPIEVMNPASEVTISRVASRRRRMEREQDKVRMEMFGGPGVFREVGDKQPQLPLPMIKELWAMSEPKRSIAWMHESFVYSSHAQMPQVTFWHAYRDFFSNPAVVEQLLSASEVIKNVQVAFPAAQAKLWADERGEKKFVIAGLGFRKGGADQSRFTCQWRGCPQRSGPSNPGELLQHIQHVHLGVPPASCGWGTCKHTPFTTAHLLTHLPLATAPQVPESLSVYSSQPPDLLGQAILTSYPPPLLPLNMHLRFTAQMTRLDAARQPTGAAFLAALTIRGLARSLRAEMEAAHPGEMGLTDAQRREKKKHLAEERFGLPIPASVLREEEEEEDETRGTTEADMADAERERARDAFRTVEERVLEVVSTNFAGLGGYLGEAFGW